MAASSRMRAFCIALVLSLSLAACQGKAAPATPAPTEASPGEPAKPKGAVPVSLPASRLDQAGDYESYLDSRNHSIAGGDVFVHGLYERPMNADTMDKYFPYLDIVDAQGYKDDTWGYASIRLEKTDANGALPGQYAVELDLDRNGRGEWLIRVSNPTGTDWSSAGVQAWKDDNGDVGGDVPMTADKHTGVGDGYDTLVFDQGNGKIVDGAYARIDTNNAATVQIAFKLDMLGSPKAYAMGAWAGTDIDPAKFDYNDFMTHAQAGSPNRGYDVYPLKALAEIDNTCRLAIGFSAASNVPGLCSTTQREISVEGGCDGILRGSTCLPKPQLANPGNPVVQPAFP